MKRCAAALLLALTVGAAAQESEESPSIAAELAGEWQIVPVDGLLACTVTLGQEPARGGWRAVPGGLCATHAPAASKAAAWTFEDGMRLLDATGAVVMAFEEDETALPASPSVAAPQFYLVPAIPGFVSLRQPGEWEGPWQITAKGQKPCVLQFGPPANLDAPREGGRVSLRKCRNRGLARMNRWYLEGMDLMLAGPDDAQIAFAPDGAETHRSDDGRWRLAHWTGR
ncbi:AprI/Inh family metalloprotease inhibitor [Erythrobacter sp. BLCC-B19]|uniref:AprI/Inh family metalloprotease inhibitor n=1 Tax=Erythrobacter sp. BLCC-B19 TaxID=3025315 RepID=UPI002360B8B1|nr:AprI/Inh family metalloprotease inhibitor [Erythrobacter sp. BLCC-B19]WDA42660.1 AprI/Inh family metalloprotease inhibitor [Erythrobacter sp. BLCC-B19]